MDSPNEIWKVDVDGVLYDADGETLRQWVLDGYVTPSTKVQKGSLKWIELGRVPAYRGLFGSDVEHASVPGSVSSDSWQQPASMASSSGSWPEQQPHSVAYGAPAAAPAGNACINHPIATTKFVCQGCGSPLCLSCVKRYGNAAVCTRCGEMCLAVGTAEVQSKLKSHLAAGYGVGDFAEAIQYPFKDPLAIGIVACLYGFLLLFGIYGKAFAAGLLFGYMSHAIRRVSMGHIDEGPSPDLSDPADLIFEAGKLGVGVSIITYGPLVLAVYFTFASMFDAEADILESLSIRMLGVVVAALWAVFYYPMALLVAGYTNSFLATINPVVGLATMGRLGFDYVKAYFMCAIVYVVQLVLTFVIGFIGPLSDGSPSKIFEAVIWLLQYIMQGAVVFVVSMVIAALLGLVLFKRPDVVDLEV